MLFEHARRRSARSPSAAGPRAAGNAASIASIAAVSAAPRLPSFGVFEDHVEARGFGQHQRAAAGEVGLDQRAVRHLAGRLVGLDRGLRLVEAVGGVAQEDQAHDGHEIFVRRQIGVGPQIVRDLPEIGFELLDALEVLGRHAARLLSSRIGHRLDRRD